MPALRRPREVHSNVLLAIFAAAAFMTSLDVFIVNVGLPISAVTSVKGR